MLSKNLHDILFYAKCIIRFILIIHIMFQVAALLGTLEFQESAKRKSHFALYNCMVLGHTRECEPLPIPVPVPNF